MSERDAIVAVTEDDREQADLAYDEWRRNGDQSRTDYFEVAATAIAMCRATHADEVERLREEIADLKSSVIAFCAPWAGQYARDFGFPPNHLHATHYDILEKAGARMVGFVRHEAMIDAAAIDTGAGEG